MGNYQDVLAVRKEIGEQNLHFGSAEAENTAYLDSIKGRLNTLKETWTSIITTIGDSEGIKSAIGVFIKISDTIDGVIKSLDKANMLIPTLVIGFSMAGKALKNLAGFGDRTIQFRGVDGALQTVQMQARRTTPLFNNMWTAFAQGETASKKVKGAVGALGTTIKSAVIPNIKGMAVAGAKALTGMVAFQAVVFIINQVAKAWEKATNGVKKAREEIQATLDEQQSEIDANKEKVRTLETTGKKYEELAGKAKRTAEEEAEMLRLGNELAEVLPEIKIGTDEEGNAIISMTKDMDGYIRSINEAIQRQEVLKAGTLAEKNENGLKMLNDGELFGKDKDGLLKQRETVEKQYNSRMKELQDDYIGTMLNARNLEGKEQQEALKQAESYRREMLKVESEYGKKYSDVQSGIMSVAEGFREEARSAYIIDPSFLTLPTESVNALEEFRSLMDFSEINSDEEYYGMLKMFRELPRLISSGAVDIENYNGKIKELNSEYAKTGNLKEYNKAVDELAKKFSDETGVDIGLVKELFTVMSDGALESANSLDTFMQKFGKTTYDISKGDGLAKALQAQYVAIDGYLNDIAGMTGKSSVDVKILTNIMTDQNIPEQIREFTRKLQNMGMSEQVILPMVGSILLDLKDGEIDNIQQVQDALAQSLNKMGAEQPYETAIELLAEITKMNTEDIKKQLEDNINGKGMSVNKNVDVEVTDNGTAEEAGKKLDALNNKPDVKKLFETKVIGMDKLDFYLNLIKQFPSDSEHTSKFIVDNYKALSDMNSYKEVIDWFNKQPKEFRQTYGVEGTVEAKQQIEEVKKKGEEVEKDPITPKVDTGELEGSVKDFDALIEASAKVKDGVYKISFQTDTASAIENITKLTGAVRELSFFFGKSLPTLVFKTETAQGSKNVTGLKTNVDDYHKRFAGKSFSTKFNTQTAQASKNMTGLKNNVSDYYKRFAGKSFSTKFNTQTALASQNVTGLINKVRSYVDKYGGQTIQTTFKVTTKYETVGSPTTQSAGAKPGKSVSADDSIGQPIPVQTLGTESVASPTPVSAVSPRTPSTGSEEHLPMPMNWSNPVEVINKGLNYFAEIENVIASLNGQLKVLEERMENSFGAERTRYLQEQIELYKQQQQAQETLMNELSMYHWTLKDYLSGKGFKFDEDNNITNYHTKLIAMEKELKRLEDISNKEKATDAQKKAYEKYKEQFDEIKSVMDEYIKTTFTDLPNANAEWENLQNEIENAKDAIEQARREIEKLVREAKVETLTDGFRDLQHELNKIDKLLKHSSGTEKLDLMEKKIELLKKQQQELDKQYSFYNNEKGALKKYLGSVGFTFDADGDITNYAKQLEELANSSKDFELIQEKLEEYFKLQNDTLPDIKEEWLDLENAIKDALKEQLNVTADMEKKITDIYKKQIQDRIDAMEKETDAKIKELKKQQDAYNKYRDEVDYDNEYDEKLSEVSDIQRQLDIAMKDTSLSGQKRVKELQKMLADAQKELEKLVQSKLDSDINDLFDKEQERLEEENDKAVEDLENEWSDSKIAEMVAQALGSGVFTDIEGNVSSLEDALINFATEAGDLFGVLGSTIKSELITNLGIAKETVKDLGNIIKDLDLNKLSLAPNIDIKGQRHASPIANGLAKSVEFNSPLIVVEGNVDSNIMDDLKALGTQIKNDVINSIATAIR